MDLCECLQIMEIDNNEFIKMDLFLLKKKYKLLALKHHPDKGGTNNKFNKLTEAYGKLNEILLLKLENTNINDNDVRKYIELFICLLRDNNSYNYLYGKCQQIINNLLRNLQDKVMKTKEDNIIIMVKPSIEDLFLNNIYKYDYEDTYFLIPLWHNEIIFEYKKKDIVFICKPVIQDNYYIDEYNNIHITLTHELGHIIDENMVTVTINEIEYCIPLEKLYIKKYQTIVLKEKGISNINIHDIYSTSRKMDIILHIHLVF